jgi:hypothetical protein
MNDDHSSNYSEANRRHRKPWSFKSLVAQLHRKAQQGGPSAESDRADESSLIGVTRWLVVWTSGLVFVGICALGAALLQWGVMRGQLIEMHSARSCRTRRLKERLVTWAE